MDLKHYIADVPDFPKPGILFRDISPLLANAEAFKSAVDSIASQWRGSVDAIAGLDARGFLFGAPVALALGVPFVMVRKHGKLPGNVAKHAYELEYGSDVIEMKHDAMKPGMRVLVVDDLLATGGTAAAACSLVESVGGVVAGCAFVIELDALNGRAKLGDRKVCSLMHYGD